MVERGMGEVILQAQAASRIELRREMLADFAAARRSVELDDDQDDVRKNWEELDDDDLELDGDEEVGRGEDQDDDFVLEDDGDLEQDGVSSRGRGEIAADMSDDETDSDGSTHSEVWSWLPRGFKFQALGWRFIVLLFIIRVAVFVFVIIRGIRGAPRSGCDASSG